MSVAPLLDQAWQAYLSNDVQLQVGLSARTLTLLVAAAVLIVLGMMRALRKPEVLVLDFAVHRAHER
jgi:hypothetical protein